MRNLADVTQLATRIPRELRRRLKVHCVEHEVSVQEVVIEAIEALLQRRSTRRES